MSTRDALLENIRTANSGNPDRLDREALNARMREHRINLMPARADTSEPERLALFIAKCEELFVSVDQLPSADDAPEAIADYLSRHNLPAEIRISSADEIADLPWDRAPLLQRATGAAVITDQVSVTPAAAGIAETGTLVLTSGPNTPATLNFVPDNHIILLKRSQIMRAMEDAFGLLRKRFGEGQLPRTVNLVSGPSKTGDVEQKLIMGAHGPRRVHVLLIDDIV
jgi:L-lactate dehydrogenase complex protein LldG